MSRINNVQDFRLKYNSKKYKEIEKRFEQDNKFHSLHFLLSLLGVINKKRVTLEVNKAADDTEYSREFSLRTTYDKYRTEMDSYYALITILDNLDKQYDEVIPEMAFEVTSTNDKKFYELTNIITFYEYMLGGIDILYDIMFVYDDKNVNVADAIQEVLESSLSPNEKMNDILIEEILD